MLRKKHNDIIYIFLFLDTQTRAHNKAVLTLPKKKKKSHFTGLHLHLFLIHRGCWGTDDITTSILHISLFLTTLWDSVNSRPVHSLMLSSHLFCLPCLLPPFTVPFKMVLTRLDEWQTCPCHFSLQLFTMVRRSSCGPTACQILARISSLVTWSLYEMRSILQQHLISMACILLRSSVAKTDQFSSNSQIYALGKAHLSSTLSL